MRYLCIFLFSLTLSKGLLAQTGISVSTPRVYFQGKAGETVTQKITVRNVSEKSQLELALSLQDWTYNDLGENIVLPPDSLPISFVNWVTVSEGSYFSLKPGEEKELHLNVTVPADLDQKNTDVKTALLFVSQMNPSEDVDSEGTNIKISVRSGVKLYFRPSKPEMRSIEVTGLRFDQDRKELELSFDNLGNTWTDGKIYTSLLNTATGKEITMEEFIFYTLPGKKRISRIELPQEVAKGNYVATVLINYGDDSEMAAAELSFSYE